MRGRAELSTEEERLRRSLAELDTQIMSVEAELTAMGGDDLGDGLASYESLFQQARGLSAVLTERRRGVDRLRGASIDQGVVASLEAEAARLSAELAEVKVESEKFEPLAAELVEAEKLLMAERLAFEEQWAGGVPAPTGAAAEVRGELAALRTASGRAREERDRIGTRVTALAEKAATLLSETELLRAQLIELGIRLNFPVGPKPWNWPKRVVRKHNPRLKRRNRCTVQPTASSMRGELESKRLLWPSTKLVLERVPNVLPVSTGPRHGFSIWI